MREKDIQDAWVTAFALGELDNEQRVREVEARLAADSLLRQEVADIRALECRLRAELSAEPAPGLDDADRAAFVPVRHRKVPFTGRRWALAAAAAIILVVGGILVLDGMLYPWNRQSDCDTVRLTMELAEGPKPGNNELAIMRCEADSICADYPQKPGQAESTQRVQEKSPSGTVTESHRGEPVGAANRDTKASTAAAAASPRSPEPADKKDRESLREGDRDKQSVPGAPEMTINEELVPLEIKLPKPLLIGTPQNFNIVNHANIRGYDYSKVVANVETGLVPGEQFGPSIEHYNQIDESRFTRVADHPLSTFSIDVDTASYSNIRRFLASGKLPPEDAVRIEEMINYFDYAYAPPTDGKPFATHLELGRCPWNGAHLVARIGIRGKDFNRTVRPPCNLVFLLDVSGSMQSANKLPLVKNAMVMLAKSLEARDRVSIVVYAGATGLVLPPTSCGNPEPIITALDRLQASGGTNGDAGITLAYATAMEHFDKEGVNRVILCTDGDFNLGITQPGGLVRMVEEKAKAGVFLSVLGFGMGNLKDSTLEQLADKGNGNYAYIDNFSEARKVLVDQMVGTLVTIAKDVKIQVEFNPAYVASYRLIGYENRKLAKEDFNDDTKDAGEIGAGHRVTALYEIIPVGADEPDARPATDPLRYQPEPSRPATGPAGEMLLVKIRSKAPDGDTSTMQEFPLMAGKLRGEMGQSQDFRFACAVASFGLLLRNSQYKGSATYDAVIEMAGSSLGEDPYGYRRAMVDLVRTAKAIAGR